MSIARTLIGTFAAAGVAACGSLAAYNALSGEEIYECTKQSEPRIAVKVIQWNLPPIVSQKTLQVTFGTLNDTIGLLGDISGTNLSKFKVTRLQISGLSDLRGGSEYSIIQTHKKTGEDWGLTHRGADSKKQVIDTAMLVCATEPKGLEVGN